MGGEKLLRLFWRMLRWGSPPRGQGKVGSTSAKTVGNRITPAWAGKSIVLIIEPKVIEDHPRVGGEKLLAMKSRATFWGSPPRGRGKVAGNEIPGDVLGITPAWAGKSNGVFELCSGRGDHPRVGGEKTMKGVAECCEMGSPPRGRGKDVRLGAGKALGGITPAWAGKSRSSTLG